MVIYKKEGTAVEMCIRDSRGESSFAPWRSVIFSGERAIGGDVGVAIA